MFKLCKHPAKIVVVVDEEARGEDWRETNEVLIKVMICGKDGSLHQSHFTYNCNEAFIC